MLCAASWLLASAWATACPICFQGLTVSPAQQIASAHRAMLVERRPSDAAFVAVAAIKGDAPDAPIALAGGGAPQHTFLAIQPASSAGWMVVGEVRRDRAELLRRIASTAPGPDATTAQWTAYAATLLPLLDDAEPLVEAIADGELARAPYAALRAQKSQLDAAHHVGHLDEPGHQALHTLLYGIAGGDARAVQQRIDRALQVKDATNLAALLTADMELRGPARVTWIETAYFADRQRTLAEVQAALLALSVQGEADGAVPRGRVVAAYRSFIKQRPGMAASVAPDLARWQSWGAVPDYMRLMKSHAIADPAARATIVAYLLQSPQAQSRPVRDLVASGSP